MLSNQVRAYIRRMAGVSMTGVCTIEEEVSTPDGMGGSIPTWEEVITGTPCRIIQAGDQNRSQALPAADQETLRIMYKLIVSHEVELGVDMRVTAGGLVYEIVQVEAELTDEAFHSAIMLRRD